MAGAARRPCRAVWLRAFAAERGYSFADYHAALVQTDAELTLSDDGLHPNAEAYLRMRPALEAAIGRLRLGR